ncbi:porin [Limnobacter litoralis]|uniref:Porin n=1 Tax=Limnobacter litoralis TaxID=481366 RepID=A0ABQ5YNA6_9BURK|nr:porin [Limnobacter litoralis]GLR24922.1 porin [Limnobacter litoralis]
MNKKLLAAALGLAFAAPVFADSSNVVLYGRVNENLVHNKTDGTAGQGTTMQDVSSRLGVKGSEDLGGGLSAIFAYEFSVAADNNNGVGGRHSYVGFKSNELGTLVFGKQDGGNDSQAPLYNQAQEVAYGVSNNGGELTTIGGGFGYIGSGINTATNSYSVINRTQRVANAIGYAKKFGDVEVNFRHAMVGKDNLGAPPAGVNSSATVNESGARQTEIAATYRHGPITVGGGYQDYTYANSVASGVAAGADNLDNLYQLVGAYDFNVAKVSLVYGSAKLRQPVAGDDRIADYRLSTWVPINGNTGLTASYGRADQLAAPNLKDKVLQVAAYYDFSKRTRTYFGVNQAKKEVAGTSDQKTTAVVLGLRHNF